MANKLGQLVCSENSKNTGYGNCVEDWKQIIGAFIFDGPKSFTKEEIAALETTLQDAANADSKASRMFPIHNFVAATDGSEKLIIENFDYGPKYPVRDGDYDWTFQFVDGRNCLQQSLRSHNGKGYALFYDKTESKILGYNKKGLLAAIPLQFFWAHPWSLATGSKTAAYLVQFVFLAKYANEERAFVKAEFDPSEITGMQDIDILVNTFNQNTGVVNATLQTACGAENLYDLFSAGLNHTTNFKAVDEDGNVVTVTSIAPVAGSKTFNITLNATQFPDSGIVYLSGTAPSVLAGNNVEGYEIGTADLTVVGS